MWPILHLQEEVLIDAFNDLDTVSAPRQQPATSAARRVSARVYCSMHGRPAGIKLAKILCVGCLQRASGWCSSHDRPMAQLVPLPACRVHLNEAAH